MTDREEFEAWWTRDVPPEYMATARMLLTQLPDSAYASERCQAAWEGWQAARATAEQSEITSEPFGYVYRIIGESRPHDPMYRFAKTGELNPDPEVVRSWTKHAVYLTSQISRSRDSVIEACAQEADKLSVKYWADYKRGKGPERANPYFEGKSDGAEDSADAIRALKSQQDAAIEPKPAEQSLDRIDAQRYRWLRAQHWNESNMAVVCDPKKSVKLGYDCPSGERLDEIIDASIAASVRTAMKAAVGKHLKSQQDAAIELKPAEQSKPAAKKRDESWLDAVHGKRSMTERTASGPELLERLAASQKLEDVSNGQWAEIHKELAEKTLAQVREILTDSAIPHVAVRVCRALEKIDLIIPNAGAAIAPKDKT
jgi:hypothetical protein